MNPALMTRDRLDELISRFSAQRIAVVGDFFLDKYLDVDPALEEVSRETGKPAHQVAAIRVSPGAAGTVVSNLAALGAGEIHAVGFTGEDGEGFELRRSLDRLGCRTGELAISDERSTPTYLKPRDLTRPGLEGEHSRYDSKNHTATPRSIEDHVIRALEELIPQVDAIIVLDQVEEEDCGVVTANVRSAVARLASQHPERIFWADSRRHIGDFRNVITKPNQFEAMGISNPQGGEDVPLDRLRERALSLRRQANAPVFVTRGKAGLLVTDEECTRVPGLRIEGPTDPTGAGDSTTAGAVLALGSGASLVEAGLVGNLAASLTVRQLGTTGTADPKKLPGQLEKWLAQTVVDGGSIR